MKIVVLGAGSFGTAMGDMLKTANGHDVYIWDYLTGDISHAAGADIIVSALPSFAIGQTFKLVKPYVRPGQIVVNLSKGLEEGTLMTLSAVIARELDGHKNIAVMSGPSHAEEVAEKIPTTNVVAAKDMAVAEALQDAFMNDYFRIYTHQDMLGVELGGALKNVIALCAGISDGLGFGDNTKAALMTRGIAEITRLGVALGAQAETFAGLSGIGDLIVTCTSQHSRNRRAGILIGQGLNPKQAEAQIGMVVEGVKTCRAAKMLADKHGVDMPIVTQAYQVLFEGKPVRETTLELMNRDKRNESEAGFLQ